MKKYIKYYNIIRNLVKYYLASLRTTNSQHSHIITSTRPFFEQVVTNENLDRIERVKEKIYIYPEFITYLLNPGKQRGQGIGVTYLHLVFKIL